MTKHNKKRYQSEEKIRPVLHCSGRVWLEYRDEEALASAARGDLKLLPSTEALHSVKRGEYWSTGHTGYFRVAIHDGRQWCPVLLADLFPARDNHFSKSECPIDTFNVCEERLRALRGAALKRTYREHYALLEEKIDGERSAVDEN